MKRSFSLILVTLLVLAATGCAGPRAFLHPDADFAAIEKAFVLPFDNFTNDKYAGDRVANVFTTQVLLADQFDIVEPGEVAQAIKDLKIRPDGGFTSEDIQNIGKALEAQAAFAGAVDQYSMERIKQQSYPVVAITVRLVDIETKEIIWMTSCSKNGAPKTPIVSMGEVPTLSKLTEVVCKDVVDSLNY